MKIKKAMTAIVLSGLAVGAVYIGHEVYSNYDSPLLTSGSVVNWRTESGSGLERYVIQPGGETTGIIVNESTKYLDPYSKSPRGAVTGNPYSGAQNLEDTSPLVAGCYDGGEFIESWNPSMADGTC